MIPAGQRQQLRPARIHRHASLHIAFTGINRGKGGAVDHHLRLVLCKKGLHLGLVGNIHLSGIAGPNPVFRTQNLDTVAAELAVCPYYHNPHDQVLMVDFSSSRSMRY